MLSEKTISIVKSTAPILDEHAETLTRHFYNRMFSHNPEVKPFFNMANQQAGLQQKALAAAICAYAANIDQLELLGGAVELIAQKHASLKIKAEHYPIVGENLLCSIKEVLGDGATEEVISAWAEAYQFLANILIHREGEIYREHREAENGWEGFQKLRVTRKERESEVITSFYFETLDGSALPEHKSGQYLTVRLPSPCGHTTMRNYSLSDQPGLPWWRISVKKEGLPGQPEGFASHYLHNHIEVGDCLEIGPPCGEFTLDPTEHQDRPLVLLSAGVGITPLMSMLLSTLEKAPQRPVYFLHGCLNGKVQAFKSVLDRLDAEHENLTVRYAYDAPEAADLEVIANSEGKIVHGQLCADYIESILPGKNADYYFCGPKPFMVSIYHQLLEWGIPGSQVHFEFFGPRQDLEKPKCPVA